MEQHSQQRRLILAAGVLTKPKNPRLDFEKNFSALLF